MLGASHLTSLQRGRAKKLLRSAYITFAGANYKFKAVGVGAPPSAASASASTPTASTA